MKKAGLVVLILAIAAAFYFWYFAPPVKQIYALSELPETFSIDLENQSRNYALSTVPNIKTPAIGLDDQFARSGKYSQKLTQEERFGMGIEIHGVGFLDQLVATAWIHEESDGGVLAFISEHRMYKGCFETGRTDGPWKEVKSIFTLDVEVLDQSVTVYCWLPYDKEGPAWFDDLTVNLIDDVNHVWPKFENPDFELTVSDEVRQELQSFRDTALDRGVLLPSEKKWMKAKLDGEKVKIKLKGDWTDHLQGPKWSFRIKHDADSRTMPMYSVQSPATRNMMAEWVVHKAYEQEGILTTDYRFVRGRFNGEFDGVYAREEHFGLDFTRLRNLPDGPVVKYDEDPLWDIRAIQRTRKTNHPYAYAAAVEAYDNDYWVENNKALRDLALSQLFLHQHNYAPAEEIIDIDKMARYLALSELFQASHSYIWHNQRFYHNPESGKLEPLAYDNCPVIDTLRVQLEHTVQNLFQKNLKRHATLNLHQSSAFVEAYLKHLKTYSSAEWQADFWQSIQGEFLEQHALLNVEFPSYHFDSTMVLDKASHIARLLDEPIDTVALKFKLSDTWIRPFYPKNEDTPPQDYVSCNCYRAGQDSSDGFFGNRLEQKLVCTSFYHKRLYFSDNFEKAPFIEPYAPEEKLTWTTAPFYPADNQQYIELWDRDSGTRFKARILDFEPDGPSSLWQENDQRTIVEFSGNSE